MDTEQRAFRIVLLIVAFFAVGAVGFFLAVLLESRAQAPAESAQQIEAIQVQKNAAMQSLSASEGASSGVVASSTPLTTKSAATSTHTTAPAAQAASNDPNASMKLQILNNLNQK